MRLSAGASHIVVLVFGLFFGAIFYLLLSGEGSYSILFWDIHKNPLAQTLSVIVFGFYCRWCYEIPILPNEQGIQLFLGTQTGEVWGESSFLFIPRPFWSIWKRVSVQHFSFTVAAQNRTQEGHSMIIFATGRAVPQNVHLLAKMSQEGVQEQVLGLCMMSLGSYIQNNARNTLLAYQQWDISGQIMHTFGLNNFYGLDINVFTTKVIEVNNETMRQFDVLARAVDTETVLGNLRQSFPNVSDVELYAMYASFVGINPAVMSYVVHGEGNNNILLGRGGV